MTVPHEQPILLAGATGMVGRVIADEILSRGGSLRAVIRPGGYDGDKATLVDALRERGMQTVEADLKDLDSLAPALDGVHTLVSALQGYGEVIVDVQTVLLRAAQKVSVTRMIPSDFATDLYRVPPGENRNFDLRRTFAALLDGTEVKATSILNGALTDLLTMGYPAIHAVEGVFDVWGDGEQPMEFTSIADTARFAAAAAIEAETPRFLRFAGESLTMNELAERCGDWIGKPLETRRLGSVDDLEAAIYRQMKENPGAPDAELAPWQAMQHLHNMVSGKGHFESLDNDRYPDIEAEDIATFLARHPAPAS